MARTSTFHPPVAALPPSRSPSQTSAHLRLQPTTFDSLPRAFRGQPTSALFCTLLQRSEKHPARFHQLAHSLQKHPGWHRVSGFVLANPELNTDRYSHFGTNRGDYCALPLFRSASRTLSADASPASIPRRLRTNSVPVCLVDRFVRRFFTLPLPLPFFIPKLLVHALPHDNNHKSFRIRTYTKCARKSFTIRTYRIGVYKSFRIRTYEKMRGWTGQARARCQQRHYKEEVLAALKGRLLHLGGARSPEDRPLQVRTFWRGSRSSSRRLRCGRR